MKAWNTGRLGSCREADHFCLPFWNSEGSEGEDSISGGWKAGLLLLQENLIQNLAKLIFSFVSTGNAISHQL